MQKTCCDLVSFSSAGYHNSRLKLCPTVDLEGEALEKRLEFLL